MNSVQEFAARGGFVLGICNGFQILCEAGLLPGALIRNRDLHFICDHVHVRVETTETPFTNQLEAGSVLPIPLPPPEGEYVCDAPAFEELKRADRIIFSYFNDQGETDEGAKPNSPPAKK